MTSAQHAERVRASLDWFDSPTLHPDKCLPALINEYFYACLHILEAVLFDFPFLTEGMLPAPVQGFDEHTARNDFLRKVAVQPYRKSRGKEFGPKHKLDAMAAPYQALYRLSRRARYLQARNDSPYDPVAFPDLAAAVASFNQIKSVIEQVYSDAGRQAPWLRPSLLAIPTPPAPPAPPAPRKPPKA